MSSAELVEIADRLYGEPPARFTAARDAAAKACPDRGLAAQVRALRKPALAAWAVNLLVRREADQIDQVLALGESLRAAAASMDAEELRDLSRQRRRLTAALTGTAGELTREHGVRLTASVADQVEAMLTAAMLDPVAAAVVRSGLVLAPFRSTGVSDLDASELSAVPFEVGHRAAAVQRPAPDLHVVPDDSVRLEVARERVQEAVLGVAAAQEQRDYLVARAERLQGRRLQLQGELDELRRRVSVLEDEVDVLDEEIEEVAEDDEAAGIAFGEAERELADARRALDRISE